MHATKKLLLVTLIGLLTLNTPASGSELKRGHIVNEDGEKCWYRQKFAEADNYFHSSITANTGHLTFDDPTCMTETDINKKQINNIVTKGYGRADVIYATGAHQMFLKSDLQERGYCIKATNYPIPAVAVDYVIQAGGITGVKHAMSFGCKN
ncbi:MAG: hypothetical protein GKS03_16145 [Alphaproteobacteria bacterium]|nr:hypothetical protein [Alphaproteobacteria bacterium]